MNDDLIADLKQFISATVVQAASHLATKDDLEQALQRLEQKVDQLEIKVDDGFSGVGEAVELINERLDELEKSIGTKAKASH